MRHTAIHEKSSKALELFFNIRRRRLINFDTPVERLERLQRAIPGAPQLWIKRDDLTGYLGGGNKLRKLEYVMADALSRGATTIVTTGSITSNLARSAALIARRLGLKCELILSGGKPESARANWRVAELLGVKIHSVVSSSERSSKMAEVARALEERGERVLRLARGGGQRRRRVGRRELVAARPLHQLEVADVARERGLVHLEAVTGEGLSELLLVLDAAGADQLQDLLVALHLAHARGAESILSRLGCRDRSETLSEPSTNGQGLELEDLGPGAKSPASTSPKMLVPLFLVPLVIVAVIVVGQLWGLTVALDRYFEHESVAPLLAFQALSFLVALAVWLAAPGEH